MFKYGREKKNEKVWNFYFGSGKTEGPFKIMQKMKAQTSH
jgi:hypothetical protein